MTRTGSRPALLALLAVLSGMFVVWGAVPADAACHIAAFEEDAYPVGEGAGSVTVTIELLGGAPSCSGAVRYETLGGTASAPGDFTAKQGVICFVANDDRKESIQVPITNDGASEPDESFQVKLEDADDPACLPDGISGADTATVTITDDDQAAPPPPAGGQATAKPAPTAAPAATTAPSTAPAVTAPVETATPSPTALPDDTGEGASGRGAIVGLAVAALLIAVAAGLFAWYRRRSGPDRPEP